MKDERRRINFASGSYSSFSLHPLAILQLPNSLDPTPSSHTFHTRPGNARNDPFDNLAVEFRETRSVR